MHTDSFLIQTPNESLKRWENATSGHKAEAANPRKTEFLCFEFLRLVELLRDTVYSMNLHHFLGIYATFLWNLCRFWQNLHPFTQCGGRVPKSM